MAYKSTGTAGKSSSGASMSKYDVEVEARLKKLEAAVAALEKHSHDTPAAGDTSQRLDDVERLIRDSGLVWGWLYRLSFV